MRRVRASIFIAALTCCLGAATSAGASSVYLPDCSNPAYGGNVAPANWSAGCVGGSINLSGLSWQGWGAATATGSGVRDQNDCDPSCASGTTLPYPTTIAASAQQLCASGLGPQIYYTRFDIVTTYPADNHLGYPAGPQGGSISAACRPWSFDIPLHAKTARIGPFDQAEADAFSVEGYFGPRSSQVDGSSCTMRWRNLGLRMTFIAPGYSGSGCSSGYFISATTTSKLWRASNGVRVGSSAKTARRKSVARCSRRRGCGSIKGFILSTHNNGCIAKAPSVVARTNHGRVSALKVFTHHCD